MSCAMPSARFWWCATRSADNRKKTAFAGWLRSRALSCALGSLLGRNRPLRDETLGLVRFDLIPFAYDPGPELRIGVPVRERSSEAVDRDQHFLHFRPVTMQGHGIAARRPGVTEADHRTDICKPECGFDHR